MAIKKIKQILGATLAEYALLIALIAVVCVVAVKVLGNNTYTTIYRIGGCPLGRTYDFAVGLCG